jgi:hypothetical protein
MTQSARSRIALNPLLGNSLLPQAWELDDYKPERLLRNLAPGSIGRRPLPPPALSKGSTRY